MEQPDNQKTGQPVIAGDTDNNLNSATVDPDVLAIEPAFQDFPDLGGSETMGAFLDLNNDGTPDIVAGISNDIGASKNYQVALAATSSSNPGAIPGFGTPLPNNRGNVYLVNDPAHPNFEFAITRFSQLYQSITGQTLTPDSNFRIGAFGNSNNDDGISEAFFPPQPIGRLFDATPPVVPPVVCPPLNPPILINPHQGRHINTAHATRIRVNVFGTSEFDPRDIDGTTVRLGGAAPITSFTRPIPGYPFPQVTFVFNGLDVDLPPGITEEARLTGQLNDGTEFSSAVTVFNRDDSFYTPAQIRSRDRRQGIDSSADAALDALALDIAGTRTIGQPMAVGTLKPVSSKPTAVKIHGAKMSAAVVVDTPATTVSIPKRQKVTVKPTAKRHLTPTMSLNAFNAQSAASTLPRTLS